MPLADGATFAGYTFLRLLGAGGMGEVYLAQQTGQTRRECRRDIRDSNGLPPLP